MFLSDILGKPNNRLFTLYFQRFKKDRWAATNNITNPKEKQAFFKDFEERLSDDIKQASIKHDTFIITSEGLSLRIKNSDEIAEIKNFLMQRFDQITIVGYFREQSDRAISGHSQKMKGRGLKISLEKFLDKEATMQDYTYNYKAIADDWAAAFGKENCKFRIYDREYFPEKDIRLDFLNILGIPIDRSKLDFSITQKNQRLSRLQTAAFIKINTLVPYSHDPKSKTGSLNKKLKNAVLSLHSLNFGTNITSKQTEVYRRFIELNTNFFKDYFDGEIGFKEPKKTTTEEKVFSLTEVEGLVSDIFEALLPLMAGTGDLKKPGMRRQSKD
ncbi:hypothetical protein CKO36_05310 [Rhabdochromatium marinum]|nr:hypothetical protein [Rhabdochromatium marinum]